MSKARKSILCIEDDHETAALIAEELGDWGFEVRVAHNSPDGLASILNQTPDLVLCDISMPFLSGFDILKSLTEIAPDFGYMPFIFLTALTDREVELKGRKLGADDFVTKPIDFDMLAAIVNARLARTLRNEAWPPAPIDLTDRETEALTWAARGKTSAEIGQILGLTKRTIDFHIDNARVKLAVATRTQAVLKATNSRLIAP
jgi:DNA-binding NarL/FixJ family response regulator